MSIKGLLEHCLEEHRPDVWGALDEWATPDRFKNWIRNHEGGAEFWHENIHKHWPNNAGEVYYPYVRDGHQHGDLK
jgi:hypothetical protein